VLDAGGKAWSRSFNNFLSGIGYVLLTEFEMELLETMYFMEFVGKKFRHEALRKFIGGGEKAIELYWNVTSNELKISLAGAAALLYSRALAAGIRDRKTLRFAVRAATLYGREKKDRGVLKTAIEYVGEIKQVSYGDLMNGLNAAMTYLGLSIDGEGYRQMLCNVYKLYERFFKLMECSGAKPSSDMLSSFERYQLKVADIITRKNADFYREVSRDSGIRYLSLELKKLADEIGVDRSVLVAEMSRVVAQAKRYPDNSHANLASKPASPSIAAASQENWEEKGKIHLLAENFFALLLKFPQLFAQHAPGLRSEFFEHTPLAGLYESLKKHYNGNIDIMVVKNSLTKEEQSAIDILVLKTDKDYSGFDAQQTSKELSILLGAIKSEWQKNKRQKLFVELKEAEKNGDPEAVQKILKEIMELEK